MKSPEIIEKIKRLPSRIKVSKEYPENDLLVFIRKGKPLFVRGMVNGETEPRDCNLEEVLERIKCEPTEKSVPRSDSFWENYIKIKTIEQKTQGGSQMSIEVKALNNLKTIMQNIENFSDEIQDFASFIRTLLDDLVDYQTLPLFTLRRLADMPTLTYSEDDQKNVIDTLVDLRNNLGTDYLEKIKNASKINTQEVVIAFENRDI